MIRRLIALLVLLGCASPGYAFQGRIVDATTGAAVAGATVTLGGHVLQTDQQGRFQSETTDGSMLLVRAPGYWASSMSAAAFWEGNATLRLTPLQPKALYLSFYGIGSQSIRQAAIKLIHEAKLNALVIDVKGDRGLIDYHTSIPLAQAVGAQRITTIPDLPALLKSLHAAGIYTIARIVTFKDDVLATARPDLAVALANGTDATGRRVRVSLYRANQTGSYDDAWRPAEGSFTECDVTTGTRQ